MEEEDHAGEEGYLAGAYGAPDEEYLPPAERKGLLCLFLLGHFRIFFH